MMIYGINTDKVEFYVACLSEGMIRNYYVIICLVQGVGDVNKWGNYYHV